MAGFKSIAKTKKQRLPRIGKKNSTSRKGKKIPSMRGGGSSLSKLRK